MCDHCGFPLQPSDQSKKETPVQNRSQPQLQIQPNFKMPKLPIAEKEIAKPAPRAPAFEPPKPERFEKVAPVGAPEMEILPVKETYEDLIMNQPEPVRRDPEIPVPPSIPAPTPVASSSVPSKITPGLPYSASEFPWKLVVVEGFTAGKEYLVFKPTMVLGRADAENHYVPDINLEDQDDGYISRKHAVLRQQQGQLMLEDLGGENGTYIDSQRLQPHQWVALRAGQVMRLGRVGLLVKATSTTTGEVRT